MASLGLYQTDFIVLTTFAVTLLTIMFHLWLKQGTLVKVSVAHVFSIIVSYRLTNVI